jgi:hypothetical protein
VIASPAIIDSTNLPSRVIGCILMQPIGTPSEIL